MKAYDFWWIKDQICLAEKVFVACQDQLAEDAVVQGLLARLRRAIRDTQTRLEEAGYPAICARCALEEKECCCGVGMELDYDMPILLINLLLGEKLPHEAEAESQCFFLGKLGCRLIARQHFCSKHFCSKLERAAPEYIAPMQEAAIKEAAACQALAYYLIHIFEDDLEEIRRDTS